MQIYIYSLRFDDGAAPNPYRGPVASLRHHTRVTRGKLWLVPPHPFETGQRVIDRSNQRCPPLSRCANAARSVVTFANGLIVRPWSALQWSRS